jgi:hypothetical protein
MSKPVVTVKNNANRDIFVAGDPNWDDQQLIVNDRPLTDSYTLTKGATATVSVDWEGAGEEGMIGVIFSDTKNYDAPGAGMYQLTVGQEPSSGKLGITDDFTSGEPDFHYTLGDQTPWTMKMDFTGGK